MQAEFNASEEGPAISIIAINEAGYGTPSNYEATGAKGSLPVLQDEAEINMWDSWEVVYRDVIVLNACGEKVGTFNLTSKSIQTEDNYAELKEMMLEAAR